MAIYMTAQRKLLLDFFENNPDKIFTAYEIYSLLQDKNISKSAVYRNLIDLEKNKKIKKQILRDSKEVSYQYISGTVCQAKIHLQCMRCDKISHMNMQSTDSFVDNIATTDKFIVNKSETVIYGLCRDCTDKEQK